MSALTSTPAAMVHPLTGRLVHGRRFPLGSPVEALRVEHVSFTVVSVTFARDLTDDEAETAAGLFGYAWAQHGAATHTGRIADTVPVVWPTSRQMVVSARMRDRPQRTRTRAGASHALFSDFARYVREGTPERKRLGGRLVGALGIAVEAIHVH